MQKFLIPIQVIGAFIRYCLFISRYQKTISNHIEISTPINSWKRIQEGMHLLHLNLYPYSSDILHEPPLNLLFYNLLSKMCGNSLHFVFIATDALTAMLLYYAAHKYMIIQKKKTLPCIQTEEKTKIKVDNTKNLDMLPKYIMAAYMFNPYIIFNCVSYTSTVFNNLFLAMFIVSGNSLISALSLALSIHNSFYPVILLSPLFLQYMIHQKSILKAIIAVSIVCVMWSLLTYFSYSIFNNWDSVLDSYRFIFEVPNLQPNIGLFWYLFSEMFDHFQSLFMFALQINATLLYLVPLSTCFRNDPILLTTTLLTLLAVFKPYPNIGDVGFVLTLQLFWMPLFSYYPQLFIACTGLFMCTVLAPIVWHLWIYAGSANANFYFGVTLGFGCVQILLVSSLLYAYIKNKHIIRYGKFKIGKAYSLHFQ